jgi:enterochelin esterase family protein
MTRATRFKALALAFFLTSSASGDAALTSRQRGAGDSTVSSFVRMLDNLEKERVSTRHETVVDSLYSIACRLGAPLVQESTVVFLYRGNGSRVCVPGDLNGWNPAADTMKRIEGTDLFYLPKTVDIAGRFEYKFVVDSIWMLDPLNNRRSYGGYGANSEIVMPRYAPPPDIRPNPTILHGRVDTLAFRSTLLGRVHPVYIYTPPGFENMDHALPSMYVMDGGEYISLGLILNVLDNLIADKSLEPVVCVLIDPRTDPNDANTSMRMVDYSLSDTFVTALTSELRPLVLNTYNVSPGPDDTGIMGASLGGLIATYATLTRPDVFGFAAAQSPSYWWKEKRIFRTVEAQPRGPVRFYIDTGTLYDARSESLEMKNALTAKGYVVEYAEYPEGHNWVNWRSRLATILTTFRGHK